MKLAWLGLLSLLCTPSIAQESSNFLVRIIQNPPGYQAQCARIYPPPRSYGSGTTTSWIDNNWRCTSAETCASNTWRLQYQRTSETTARGGRCVTGVSPTIKGNGVFSARLYIHSNVAVSDGVFTIGALPVPFTEHYELDLIVVNIQEGVAKFGLPNHAHSIPLSSLQQRWITVTITKTGNSCDLEVKREGASTLAATGLLCRLKDEGSRVVINSRARKYASDSSAFVTISDVRWTAGN